MMPACRDFESLKRIIGLEEFRLLVIHRCLPIMMKGLPNYDEGSLGRLHIQFNAMRCPIARYDLSGRLVGDGNVRPIFRGKIDYMPGIKTWVVEGSQGIVWVQKDRFLSCRRHGEVVRTSSPDKNVCFRSYLADT